MNEAKMVVYGFETSNNIKVRLALEYKSIPYEFRSIEPGDRDELLRISGQFLTPVMVDGGTVLFDSAAILRYLDANFPDTPKLYGGSQAEQWEIEDWERFGRGPLAESMTSLVHARVTGQAVSREQQASASKAFETAVRGLEARLDGRQWIVGQGITAADITCGAVIYRVRSSGVLPWPTGSPRSEALADRIMALLA